jgi:hypothetical protein
MAANNDNVNWSRRRCLCASEQCKSVFQQNRRRGRQIANLWSRLESMLDNVDERLVHEVPIGASLPNAEVAAHVARIREAMRLGAVPNNPKLPGHECPVCFEGFNDGARFPASVGCGHVFCMDCMSKLQRMECPMCNKTIDKVIRLFI